jgi:rubredoxin
MQLFGNKQSAEERLEELGYWPGEWVCADCGYIYEPGTRPAFEELRTGWKCPQCAGPRRRFVKKAGGVIAAVDDTPLLVGTLVSALILAGLTYLGLTI